VPDGDARFRNETFVASLAPASVTTAADAVAFFAEAGGRIAAHANITS
jgi:hypothetical protein